MGIFGFWMIKFVYSEVIKKCFNRLSSSCKNASAVLNRLCMFIIKRKSFLSLTFYIKQLFNGVQSISISLIYFLFVCIFPLLIVLTMVLNIHRRNCLVCHERYTSLDWFHLQTADIKLLKDIENFKDRQFSKPQLQSVSILFSFAHPWHLVYLLCYWNSRSMFEAFIYTTLLNLLARS